MSKININKNSIIYNDIISSVDETGLLLDGGNWKINRDGSASFTNIDGYIPNAGNTKSGELNLTRDTYTFNLPSSAPLLYTAPLSGHAFSEPVISVSNAAVSISYTLQGRKTGLMLINGKAYYFNPDNSQVTDSREIAVMGDFDGYIPNEGNIEDIDFTLQRNKITFKSNTYIETDNNVYGTLKGKTSLNSGSIYLELLDAPTYGSWNSQLGINVETGITWSRNHLKGNTERYKTTVELKDNGYLVHTTDTTNNLSDIINLYSGGLNLENNRVTDTQHNRGQVVLSTKSGLFISKRDNNNNETHHIDLECVDSNRARLFLRVNDGINKWVSLDLDGLTLGGTDIAVESLYLNKDGIGYTTKEAYNRKLTYYLTSSATNISYKNQSQTGTLTFKPVTIDGEVQFKIANTIEDTTHEVTIYNGHTSTTQTEFNSTDYVTKQYVSSIIPDVNSCIPNEGNVLTSIDTDITRSALTLKSMNTLISTAVTGAPDSYINLTPTHIILDNNRNNEASSSIELSNLTVNIISKSDLSVITLETGNSDNNKTWLKLRGVGDGETGLHYYGKKNKEFKLDVSEKMFNGETDGGRVQVWNEAIGTQAELTLDDKFTVQYYNNEVTMLANGTSTFGDNEGVELYLVNGTGYLNKANAPKLYNDPTTELVIKGDLDNYVSKTEYNELKDGYDDLLEKYNDLTDRLNAFLEATGDIEPEPVPGHTFVTVPTDTVTLAITPNIDNAFTINWGDGSEFETTGPVTYDKYDNPEEQIFTHTYANNEVQNIDVLPVEPDNEEYTGTITCSVDCTEMALENLGFSVWGGIYEMNTLEKFSCNNYLNYFGCGSTLLSNCENLKEITLGNKWQGVQHGAFSGVPSLNKLTLDVNENFQILSYLIESEELLDLEIHCTSITPFKLGGMDGDTELTGYFVNGSDESNIKIYVPAQSVDAYKNAEGWEHYTNQIYPEP